MASSEAADNGDMADAQSKAKTALILNIVGMILGIVAMVTLGVLYAELYQDQVQP